MSVFVDSSMSTFYWLLDPTQIMMELSIPHGLVLYNTINPLAVSEASTLQQFPRPISSAIGWLNIDPSLVYIDCCTSCVVLYSESRTPMWGNNIISTIPCGPSILDDANSEISPHIVPLEMIDQLSFVEENRGHSLLHFFREK